MQETSATIQDMGEEIGAQYFFSIGLDQGKGVRYISDLKVRTWYSVEGAYKMALYLEAIAQATGRTDRLSRASRRLIGEAESALPPEEREEVRQEGAEDATSSNGRRALKP